MYVALEIVKLFLFNSYSALSQRLDKLPYCIESRRLEKLHLSLPNFLSIQQISNICHLKPPRRVHTGHQAL